MAKERFKNVEPLTIGTDDEFALIDQSPHAHQGDLWINYGWLTVADARELRDWLNEVIP